MNDCAHAEERLVDYLDGTLPARECEAVDTHVAGCDACRIALRESRAILEMYRSLPEQDVSAEVAGKLLAAARPKPLEKTSRRAAWRRVAAVAVVLVVAALGLLWFERAGSAAAIAALLREAEAHLAAGEPRAALEAYERALELAREDAQTAEILHRAAELRVAGGDNTLALDHLARLISTYPDYADLEAVLLLRGRALEQAGKLEQARALYRVVAAEFPGSREQALRKLEALESSPSDVTIEALQGLGYSGE